MTFSILLEPSWQPLDQDDELLLDAPSEITAESGAVQPSEGDIEMHIDEEGRPRFPAAKQTVCYLPEETHITETDMPTRRVISESKAEKFPYHHTEWHL